MIVMPDKKIDISDLLKDIEITSDKPISEVLSERRKKENISPNMDELLDVIKPQISDEGESKRSSFYDLAHGTYDDTSGIKIDIDLENRKLSPITKKLLNIGETVKSTLSFIDNILEKLKIKDKLAQGLNSAGMLYTPDEYVALAISYSLIATIVMAIILLPLFVIPNGFPIIFYPLIIVLIPIFSFIIALIIPSSRANYRAMEIERELPFALRHLATELRAGVGIVSSFESIAKSDYGALSEEFERIVQDIRKGKTTEEALRAAAERVKSLSFKRAIMNFIRAVRTGGAISEIIGNIAKDTSYELNMKIRDFVEKLNMIGLIFIMVGVVIPVMISILGAITAANPTLPLSFVNGPFLIMVYFMSLFLVGMTIAFVKIIQPM